MKKQKVYLKQEIRTGRVSFEEKLTIFIGDIDKDRNYQKKYHNTETKYFELKEVKK